ncbi:MAG: hypothetical protein ACR2OH_00350 [Microthrixaceae bacterium]
MTGQPMTIDSAHNGPPGSGHGGVVVGRLAELVGPGPAEVRLLAPPPLETPLSARPADAQTPGFVVSSPEADIARVTALDEDVSVDGFARLAASEVQGAADQYLARVSGEGHAFPTCFGCGHKRGDEALRQFTGVASDGDTLARFRVAGDGPLPDWLTIAGLDCPSGWTVFMVADPSPEAAVLASMQCQVHEPATAGVDYQVRGRLLGTDGRKHFTEVAMIDPDGQSVAAARTLWIEVDPATFGA